MWYSPETVIHVMVMEVQGSSRYTDGSQIVVSAPRLTRTVDNVYTGGGRLILNVNAHEALHVALSSGRAI
eukprot:409421-Pyramimonas_sp.AAC.1